jgi:ABC-type nickel/cobalt efflux system permease component RcnA
MHQSVFFVLSLGFILGVKHATEADHLVAVATIVSERHSVWRAAIVGATWGVGHTLSLFTAGLIVILLGVAVPPGVTALLELAVALMIVLLGSRILYLILRKQKRIHVHPHQHGSNTHSHLHFHERSDQHAIDRARHYEHPGHGRLTGWRSLIVGMVHGFAGSAALTLLVLTEVMRGGSELLGLAYLVIFGMGSIGGMLLMSMALSLPFVLATKRFERINVPIRLTAGIAGVAFGIYHAAEVIGRQ